MRPTKDQTGAFNLSLPILEDMRDDDSKMIDEAYQYVSFSHLPQFQWSNKDNIDIMVRTYSIIERNRKWIEKKINEQVGYSTPKRTLKREQRTSYGINISKSSTTTIFTI